MVANGLVTRRDNVQIGKDTPWTVYRLHQPYDTLFNENSLNVSFTVQFPFFIIQSQELTSDKNCAMDDQS